MLTYAGAFVSAFGSGALCYWTVQLKNRQLTKLNLNKQLTKLNLLSVLVQLKNRQQAAN